MEKTPKIAPESDSISNIRKRNRESKKERREKCCRLPNGLTMYDLYSMPQEEFEKLEKVVPGAKYMHPFCLAETFGRHRCKGNDGNDNDDDDDELIILDFFIGFVAKNQNKTLRGIEDNIEFCEVSNMPMNMVRNKTLTT